MEKYLCDPLRPVSKFRSLFAKVLEQALAQRTARLLFLFTGVTLFLAGCTTPQDFESDRPMKYIHGLVVNTQNDVRYCTRMSEERGEGQLRRLAETSEFEEVWIYIPKIKQWGEIGINEGKEIVDENDPRYKKRSVDLDGNYINAVAKRFKEFTIYHIHNLKRRIASNVIFYNPQCSLPSFEDLYIDLKIKVFYDQINEGHSIRFKSVSPVGVTEVRFSKYASDHPQELLTEKEAIKGDLARFEALDFTKPLHLSTFRGNIDIDYTPLVKTR